LSLPLGDVHSDFIHYMEQCVAGLGDMPRGMCSVNGYPVYADPDSKIILAAVCGAAGVAVRLPAYFTGKIIAEGAKDYLAYEGGQKRLNTPFSGAPDGWVITDGTQNLANIQRGLSAVRSLLASQIAQKATIDTINAERPENETVMAYLKTLNATLGSSHPDVNDFVFGTLPQNAGVKVIRKVVENVIAMVHPETSVILGFYRNEYLYLRLPQPVFAESLTITNEKGNHPVFAFPDAGMDWVSFAAFSITTKSPALLAAAYQYAGAK
jgi:hypothetical protein